MKGASYPRFSSSYERDCKGGHMSATAATGAVPIRDSATGSVRRPGRAVPASPQAQLPFSGGPFQGQGGDEAAHVAHDGEDEGRGLIRHGLECDDEAGDVRGRDGGRGGGDQLAGADCDSRVRSRASSAARWQEL